MTVPIFGIFLLLLIIFVYFFCMLMNVNLLFAVSACFDLDQVGLLVLLAAATPGGTRLLLNSAGKVVVVRMDSDLYHMMREHLSCSMALERLS